MRYFIVGCGRVGSALAKLLDADGHEVIVVDENAAAFKRLGQKFKGHEVVGTGIDYDVLKRAGAATADGFVAVTNGDNRNIMAALIAQRMFKIKQIVARIYDPPRGQMYRELGVADGLPDDRRSQDDPRRADEAPGTRCSRSTSGSSRRFRSFVGARRRRQGGSPTSKNPAAFGSPRSVAAGGVDGRLGRTGARRGRRDQRDRRARGASASSRSASAAPPRRRG